MVLNSVLFSAIRSTEQGYCVHNRSENTIIVD